MRAVDGSRTLSHAEVPDPLPAPGTKEARAVYDIPKPRPWGNRIAAYMVTKAIASGALLAAALGLSSWALVAATDRSAMQFRADGHTLVAEFDQRRHCVTNTVRLQAGQVVGNHFGQHRDHTIRQIHAGRATKRLGPGRSDR